MVEKTLRSFDRRVILTLLFQQHDQFFGSQQKQLAQAVSLRQNPLIIATGQQVPTIQVYRLLERLPQRFRVLGLFCLLCLGNRLFKIQDVKRPAGIRMFWQPLQAVPVNVQETVGTRESLAQLMQQLAQVRVRLGLGRIRPQEKGQVRASLGGSPVQYQIGAQGLQTGDIDHHHGSVTRHKQEVAKQMYVKGRDHQQPPDGDTLTRLAALYHIQENASAK